MAIFLFNWSKVPRVQNFYVINVFCFVWSKYLFSEKTFTIKTVTKNNYHLWNKQVWLQDTPTEIQNQSVTKTYSSRFQSWWWITSQRMKSNNLETFATFYEPTYSLVTGIALSMANMSNLSVNMDTWSFTKIELHNLKLSNHWLPNMKGYYG